MKKVIFLFCLLIVGCINPEKKISKSPPDSIIIEFRGYGGLFHRKGRISVVLRNQTIIEKIWKELRILEPSPFTSIRGSDWILILREFRGEDEKYICSLGFDNGDFIGSVDGIFTFELGSFSFENDKLALYLKDLMQIDLIEKTPLEADGSFDNEYIREAIEREIREKEQ